MRIEQLEYLIEIAKYGSINTASKKLHISQQTLSNSMKSLEQEVGVKLLERTYKGVNLTDSGKEMVKTSTHIIRKLNQTLEMITRCPNQQNEKLKGELTVLVSPALSVSILPLIMNSFSTKYPKVSIAIHEHDTYRIAELLQKPTSLTNPIGLVNIPRINGDLAVENGKIGEVEFHPTGEDLFIACVSQDHVLAKYKELSIKTILKHPIVLYVEYNKEYNTLYQLLNHYENLNISTSTSNNYNYRRCIALNRGVGFMTTRIVEMHEVLKRDGVVFIPIKERIAFTTGYLLPQNYKANPVVEKFIDILKEY